MFLLILLAFVILVIIPGILIKVWSRLLFVEKHSVIRCIVANLAGYFFAILICTPLYILGYFNPISDSDSFLYYALSGLTSTFGVYVVLQTKFIRSFVITLSTGISLFVIFTILIFTLGASISLEKAGTILGAEEEDDSSLYDESVFSDQSSILNDEE